MNSRLNDNARLVAFERVLLVRTRLLRIFSIINTACHTHAHSYIPCDCVVLCVVVVFHEDGLYVESVVENVDTSVNFMQMATNRSLLHVSSSRMSLVALRCPLPNAVPVLAALDDDTTTAFSLALVVCV